jgi:hypothetical protein
MAQPARRRDQAGKLYLPAIQRWVSLHKPRAVNLAKVGLHVELNREGDGIYDMS